MLRKEVRSYIRTAISLIVIWACVLGIGCQDTQNDLVSRSPAPIGTGLRLPRRSSTPAPDRPVFKQLYT